MCSSSYIPNKRKDSESVDIVLNYIKIREQVCSLKIDVYILHLEL